MDGFGGGPLGLPMMRDEGPDGMLGRGDHGPPMMHHSLPGDVADRQSLPSRPSVPQCQSSSSMGDLRLSGYPLR